MKFEGTPLKLPSGGYAPCTPIITGLYRVRESCHYGGIHSAHPEPVEGPGGGFAPCTPMCDKNCHYGTPPGPCQRGSDPLWTPPAGTQSISE